MLNYDALISAIDILDDESGTLTVCREIEWLLKRSARRDQRRWEDQQLMVTAKRPTLDPLQRFRLRVKVVIDTLTPNGELVCQTKNGFVPLQYPQRIFMELKPVYDWLEIEHVRAAQHYLLTPN